MSVDFLKKNWAILAAYLVFVIYLVTGIGAHNPYLRISERIQEYSSLSLSALLLQLILWRKSANKFSSNQIAIFCSLLVVNLYFFCDSNALLGEKLGIILNALSVLAALILVVQALVWIIFFCIAKFNKS